MTTKLYRIKIVALLVIMLFGVIGAATAQQCGPACPACSGKATGGLLPQNTLMGSTLYIPDGEEETTVFNLRYGIFSWLDAGIGYARDEEETIWSVRIQPIQEDKKGWQPGLILGSGSVQTGGSDQSLYIQLVKSLEITDWLALNASGGYATDLPDYEEDWGLGTITVTLFKQISPFYTYDGINSHVGLSWLPTDWLTLSGYYLEMEELAISIGIQWSIGKNE